MAAATPAAQAKGVRVTSELPDTALLAVLGDPARLRQIAWHLLVERDQVHARAAAP